MPTKCPGETHRTIQGGYQYQQHPRKWRVALSTDNKCQRGACHVSRATDANVLRICNLNEIKMTIHERSHHTDILGLIITILERQLYVQLPIFFFYLLNIMLMHLVHADDKSYTKLGSMRLDFI